MEIDYLKKLQEAMAGQDDGDVMSPALEEVMPVEAIQASNEADDTPIITEKKIDNVNEQAESPYMKSSEETAPEYDEVAKYKELMDKYESELNEKAEPESGDQFMNWLTAGGQVADIMNRDAGRDVSGVKYWDDKISKGKAQKKKEKLSGIEKLQGMQSGYKKLKDLKVKKGEKVYQTRSGLVKVGSDGKVESIYKDPYMETTGKVREESLNLRKDKFSDTKIQKSQDDAAKAISSLRTTDTWKSAEKAVSNIPEIEILLDDAYNNGGQSLAMLGPRVAKGIAGEVGVLTEQDVTRYVKNPSLVGGMLDTMAKLKAGKITEASYENLKRLLEISKKTASEKLNTAIDREAILLSRREGIPFEDAKYMLDAAYKVSPSEKISKPKSEYVTVIAPNGEEARVKRDKVKKYLDKGATIKE